MGLAWYQSDYHEHSKDQKGDGKKPGGVGARFLQGGVDSRTLRVSRVIEHVDFCGDWQRFSDAECGGVALERDCLPIWKHIAHNWFPGVFVWNRLLVSNDDPIGVVCTLQELSLQDERESRNCQYSNSYNEKSPTDWPSCA